MNVDMNPAVQAVRDRERRQRRLTIAGVVAVFVGGAIGLVLQGVALRELAAQDTAARRRASEQTRDLINEIRRSTHEHARETEREHRAILLALIRIARRAGIEVGDLPRGALEAIERDRNDRRSGKGAPGDNDPPGKPPEEPECEVPPVPVPLPTPICEIVNP